MTDLSSKYEIFGREADRVGLKHTAEITTAAFRLAPSVHARQAIMRRAGRFWLAGALPLGVLVVGGICYDSRLLFIAAAVLFILFPTLLFIGWYGILTRPWAVASVFPQIVTLGDDNEIMVEYRSLPSQAKCEDGEDPDSGRTAAPAAEPPSDLLIPRKEISDCHMWGDNVVVSYSGNRELIIPFSAFHDQNDATAFIRRLSRF